LIGSTAPNGSSISSTAHRPPGRDHADALLLATGQLTRVAMQVLLGFELDHAHQFAGAVVAFLFVPAQQARHHGDVFLDGHVREQTDLLDHVADVAAQGHFVEVGGVFAIDQDLARGRLIRRLIIFSVVLLPQPDGPRNTQISPSLTVRLTESTALTSLPLL
jgi:hypothetical protein